MVGNALRRAGELGWLTDANVQSSTTLASLEAKVTAGAAHADQQPLKTRINQALDIGGASSELTTSIITNSTGVANLATNTQYDQGRSYGSVDV
jgi:hypothetical protein